MFDGKAIRNARIATGLKGKELATRVGVTNVTISRIENQRQAPSRNLAERIALQLGVDVELFYNRLDRSDRDGGIVSMPKLSSEENEILGHFRRLDHIGQAKVWAFVMGLASSTPAEGIQTVTKPIKASEKSSPVAEAHASQQARLT